MARKDKKKKKKKSEERDEVEEEKEVEEVEEEEEETEDEDEDEEEEEEETEETEDEDEEEEDTSEEMNKFLKDTGFKSKTRNRLRKVLKKKYTSVKKLVGAIKSAREDKDVLSDRGAIKKIVRDIEDETSRVSIDGIFLCMKEIERGQIMDIVEGTDNDYGSVLVGKDIEGDFSEIEYGSGIALNDITQSKGDKHFYIYRDNSSYEISDDAEFDEKDYEEDIGDIKHEGVYYVAGVIGRTKGKYNSGVESVPVREEGELVQADVLNDEGTLNLRVYITDGEDDIGVKIKDLEMLVNLVEPDDSGKFTKMLRKKDNKEALRVLRNELSGMEVCAFGRASVFSVDGTELDNPWMDLGKWGFVEEV